MRSVAERFASKVNVLGPLPDDAALGCCHVWTAALNSCGYGSFFLDGSMRAAHRVAYEMQVGRIPDGRELDHLCRNRACVNPAHLDPVTHHENMTRSPLLRLSGQPERDRTHCPHGHPYDTSNTVLRNGKRECRTCVRERAKRRWADELRSRSSAA